LRAVPQKEGKGTGEIMKISNTNSVVQRTRTTD